MRERIHDWRRKSRIDVKTITFDFLLNDFDGVLLNTGGGDELQAFVSHADDITAVGVDLFQMHRITPTLNERLAQDQSAKELIEAHCFSRTRMLVII
jgi:hypothetical protein